MEFISINDRFPKDKQKRLVYRPNAHLKPHCDPNITTKEYSSNRKEFKMSPVQPTLWQPLPVVPAA